MGTVWVWATRNNIKPNTQAFVDKAKLLGLTAALTSEPKAEPKISKTVEDPYIAWLS